MCALSNVMDESIAYRGQLIRIVAAMTIARVVVEHTSGILASQARTDLTRLTAKIWSVLRNGVISKRIGFR